MASKVFYVQKTKQLHKRYSLSANAVLLLKALDDYRVGIIDHAELGRIVRMSKKNRKAVTDTIAKCAAMMEKQPGEMKDCIALIQNCTEILEVADEPKEPDSLPFLKFPKEIRVLIYEHYIRQRGSSAGSSSYSSGSGSGGAGGTGTGTGISSTGGGWHDSLCPRKPSSDCRCFPKLGGGSGSGSGSTNANDGRFSLTLARTCKAIQHEFLEYVYGREAFAFTCTCDMYHHLQANQLLHRSIRSIKVHWCGPLAHTAFALLASCPALRQLHIVISRATTNTLTPRQADILAYFPTQRPARLCDALGIDELLTLRGMAVVRVSHIPVKQGSRRTEEERTNLQALLSDKLVKPREDQM